MFDVTVPPAPRPPAALGSTVAFVLRRLIAAAHAAVLVVVLLVTMLVLLLVRVVLIAGTRFMRVVLIAGTRLTALVAAGWRRLRRRPRRPRARPRNRGTSIVALADRSALAVAVGAMTALRHAAQRERRDLGRFGGITIRAAYRSDDAAPAGMVVLRDPATWRDFAYWCCSALTMIAAAAVTAVTWLPAPTLAVIAVLSVLEPGPPGGAAACQTSACWLASQSLAEQLLLAGGALVLALLAPRITRWVATVWVRLGVTLLGPGEQERLQTELDEQRARRRLMVEAAEQERRRIERDLHDGAQQRLVSLAMTLGMARERFATDPAAAERLVAEAHGDAKLALGELRTLARGIHPAVLTDRGLDAALTALAARAGVPVDIDIDTARRLPAAVESAAYFVVAEALTNVTRHAAATRASVAVTAEPGRVVVEITDDGIGGADPAAGTGLAGLAGRIDGMDGHLAVDSPLGGPTTVRAELPCA